MSASLRRDLAAFFDVQVAEVDSVVDSIDTEDLGFALATVIAGDLAKCVGLPY